MGVAWWEWHSWEGSHRKYSGTIKSVLVSGGEVQLMSVYMLLFGTYPSIFDTEVSSF